MYWLEVMTAVTTEILKSQWFNTQEIIQGPRLTEALISSMHGLQAHLEH